MRRAVIAWWAAALAGCEALDWLTTRAIVGTGGYELDRPMAHLMVGPLWWPLLAYKVLVTLALTSGALLAARYRPRLTRPYMVAAVLVTAAAPLWNLAQLGRFLLAHHP